MSHRAGLTRTLCISALAALAACFAGGLARAAETKVPNADQIKKKLQALYNGDIPPDSASQREGVLVEIGKILDKDKNNLALKSPAFWTDAIQEGRFSGTKHKLGPKQKVAAEELEVVLKDGKKVKSKIWFRAGAMVNGSEPAPLVVCVLDKDTDPQNYLATAWGDPASDYVKHWVFAAVVDGDTFPCSKEPRVLVSAFRQMLDRYNIDANRWYVEGVGGGTDAVQLAATEYLSHRLAGMILRDPAKAIVNKCSTLYPVIVVRSQTNDKGKEAFEAYKKVDEKNDAEAVVPDLPTVKLPNEALNAWLAQHPRRVLPTAFPWVTTITDTGEGEQWTGCVWINAPAKRGEKTELTVKYIRDTNTVDVQCENLGEFYVYLNDDLLDLDKDVTILVNGEPNVTKRVERVLKEAIDTADTYGEYGRIFTASIRCVVKAKIAAPAPPAAGPDAKPGDKPAGGDQPPGGQPPGNPPPGNPPGNQPPK